MRIFYVFGHWFHSDCYIMCQSGASKTWKPEATAAHYLPSDESDYVCTTQYTHLQLLPNPELPKC